jgi:hypothetical protein
MSQWAIRAVERCNWFDPLELVGMLYNVVGARTLRKRRNQLTLMIDAQCSLPFAHQYYRTSYRWVRW